MGDPYRENANQNTTPKKSVLKFRDREEREFWKAVYVARFNGGVPPPQGYTYGDLADKAIERLRERSCNLP